MEQQVRQELLIELVATKQQLRIAEQNLQQVLNQPDNLTTQIELYDLRAKIRLANMQIESQEKIISELRSENCYLKEQVAILSGRLHDQLTKQVCVNDIKPEESPMQPEQVFNQVTNKPNSKIEEQRMKANDIAMKLKMMKNDKEVAKENMNETPLDLRFFVGRISVLTDESHIRQYFSQFGDIADVFMPREGSAHRGYGFVTFSKLFGDKPLQLTGHKIDERPIYVDLSNKSVDDGKPTKTLLVSGLIQNSSNVTLNSHFAKYGNIISIQRIGDHDGKFARSAFIHYQEFDSVNKALLDKRHLIDGFVVDCRRAHFTFDSQNVQEEPESPQLVKSCNLASSDVADCTKLMISKLNRKTTHKTLKTYFSQFGKVLDAYVPTVYGSGESKCFGYVVMPGKTSFDLRSHIIDGEAVIVSHENTHHTREQTSTLLVSAGPAIIAKIREKALEKFFSRYGKVTSVRKFVDPLSKKPCHYAFVEFTSTKAVEKVIENIGYYIEGHLVTVTKSRFDPHKT